MPHGTGRTVRVIAFARGDKAQEAEAAGADVVGENDLIERVKAGFTDFDVAVATPGHDGAVGKELGRILAQKMPNPKSGTVTPNIGNAIRDIKAGKVEYRLDKTGIVHTIVGKASFEESQLAENINDAARRDRPREAVGREGHVPAQRSRSRARWARASKIDPTRAKNARLKRVSSERYEKGSPPKRALFFLWGD